MGPGGQVARGTTAACTCDARPTTVSGTPADVLGTAAAVPRKDATPFATATVRLVPFQANVTWPVAAPVTVAMALTPVP